MTLMTTNLWRKWVRQSLKLFLKNAYSAQSINIHVKNTQTIPQMSFMHQNRPPKHLHEKMIGFFLYHMFNKMAISTKSLKIIRTRRAFFLCHLLKMFSCKCSLERKIHRKVKFIKNLGPKNTLGGQVQLGHYHCSKMDLIQSSVIFYYKKMIPILSF